MKRFVVEGYYEDPEDGSTTADYIMAKDGDSAAKQVGAARKRIANGWHVSMVSTFADHIAELERVSAFMRGMSDADIYASWRETKGYLRS